MGLWLWNANFRHRLSQYGTHWSTPKWSTIWLTTRRSVETLQEPHDCVPQKVLPQRTDYLTEPVRISIRNMMRKWAWSKITLFLSTPAVQNEIYATIRDLIPTTNTDTECLTQHQWYPISLTTEFIRTRSGNAEERTTEMIRSTLLWIIPSDLKTCLSTSIQLISKTRPLIFDSASYTARIYTIPQIFLFFLLFVSYP